MADTTTTIYSEWDNVGSVVLLISLVTCGLFSCSINASFIYFIVRRVEPDRPINSLILIDQVSTCHLS